VAVRRSHTTPRSTGSRTRERCRPTALAVVTELFRDWAGPLAAPALDVIHWYFLEVPKHTNGVGVAEAETLAAAAAGTH